MGVLSILLWGFVAIAAMATALEGSQFLGLSRLSLLFLTFATGDRHRAMILGFALYLLGGWAFAGLYYLMFREIGLATGWLGAMLGLANGAILLVVLLPLLPHLQPRLASEEAHGGALLEPPGFAGLNFARRTPLVTLLGELCYGPILGAA